MSGIPVTRQITKEAPGLWCAGVHSYFCCNDVRAVIFILSVRDLRIHPSEPEPESEGVGLRWVDSLKDMGKRAGPMQWVLARQRQNTGEQQLPEEDTDCYIGCSSVHTQGSKPAPTGAA